MGMVGVFIGVCIIIAIGAQILGSTVQDCTTFNDYNSSSPLTSDGQTGWTASCLVTNESTQSAFSLLVIVLIVISAIIILSVIKLL